MKGLTKGLTININIGTPNVSISPKKKTTIKPKKISNTDESKAAALDLELINKNRLNDNELMDLGERLALFARDLLKRKKSTCLREFMDKAKNHLTGDMLSMVKDEIELSKVKVG